MNYLFKNEQIKGKRDRQRPWGKFAAEIQDGGRDSRRQRYGSWVEESIEVVRERVRRSEMVLLREKMRRSEREKNAREKAEHAN